MSLLQNSEHSCPSLCSVLVLFAGLFLGVEKTGLGLVVDDLLGSLERVLELGVELVEAGDADSLVLATSLGTLGLKGGLASGGAGSFSLLLELKLLLVVGVEA